ncbi:hypothetical protein C2869_04750 [Saccharobesus litoralis]|uniref:Uncharacterized protein n=1 Tax=Saccharobesus litoralis TaxID=2172099 RepID=A0A2S0VNJ3_9ALTE|nr:hypothetical protein [Saccharobesus litoralis]AWB65788.1 hypothetical protein C2869_04750 [Saccharobesus litoralis]
MKKFNNTLLAGAIAMTLAGCSEDYTPSQKVENAAPQHGGDIAVSIGEKNEFAFYHLLGSPEGGETGAGIAVDSDGDFIKIENLSVAYTDENGNEVDINADGFVLTNGVMVKVTPSVFADELHTGQTYTATYSYDISDGRDSVNRKMTLTVNGEDFKPEFENILQSFTTLDTAGEVNLLSNVTDGDGDTVTLDLSGDKTVTVNNDKAVYSRSGDVITLDVQATAAALNIAPGASADVVFTWYVTDGWNSEMRTATVTVQDHRVPREAPQVVAVYEATVTTNDPIQKVELDSGVYFNDRNGDDINIDLSDIKPVGDAPKFAFNKTQGSVLAVDPVDFYAHLQDGETKTFTYTFGVDDGPASGETAGGNTMDAEFKVTVTKEAPANLISNGDFETGDLTNWTVSDNTLVNVQTVGDAWQGGNMLVSTAETTAETKFAVQAGGSYYVKTTDRSNVPANTWGQGGFSTTVDSYTKDYNFHPSFDSANVGQDWNDYKHQVSSFSANANGNSTFEIKFTSSAKEVDSVFAGRYSTESLNNLAIVKDSNDKPITDSIDFEGGTVGNWTGSIAVTTDANLVLSGTTSGVLSAWGANLTLPAGTIENGKQYILSVDVRLTAYDAPAGSQSPIRMDLETADGTAAVLGDPIASKAFPRGRNFLKQTLGGVTKVERFIDPDSFNNVNDWATKGVRISFSPSSWNGIGELIIDNVKLIQVK